MRDVFEPVEMLDDTPEDYYLDDVGDTITLPHETALWRAVITQALMDAGSNSCKREARIERMRAIAWLAGNSKDFYEVCARASMHPDYVKRKAKQAIACGCAWRKQQQRSIHRKKKPVRRSNLYMEQEVKSLHPAMFSDPSMRRSKLAL